jgi:hypothetical protein
VCLFAWCSSVHFVCCVCQHHVCRTCPILDVPQQRDLASVQARTIRTSTHPLSVRVSECLGGMMGRPPCANFTCRPHSHQSHHLVGAPQCSRRSPASTTVHFRLMRCTSVTVDIAITPCTATHRLRLPVEFQTVSNGDVAAALRRGGAWLRPPFETRDSNLKFSKGLRFRLGRR